MAATAVLVRPKAPQTGPVVAGPGTEAPPAANPTGTAVILFTGFGDLRLHDHPALKAARTARCVAPLFVFDPEQLEQLSRRRLGLLRSCVEDLDAQWRAAYGHPLMVREGNTAHEVIAFCERAGVRDIYVHEDPTQAAVSLLRSLRLAAAAAGGLTVHGWATPLRPDGVVLTTDLYSTFLEHTKGLRLMPEVRSPESLPEAPQNISAGTIPTLAHLIQLAEQRLPEEVVALRVRAEGERGFGMRTDGGERVALSMLRDLVALGSTEFARRHLPFDLTASLEQRAVARVARTRRQWWQFGTNAVETVNWGLLAPGEIVSRAFSELVALGCVSPRRLMSAVGRGARDDTEDRVTEFVEWREWHRLLACRDVLLDPIRPDHPAMQYRYWRYNGFLARYAVGGLETNGPAVVLVHGFGASADQWHYQFGELTRDHTVFALDLVGFGHAEKPALSYNQYFWEDQVKTFGMEVVRRPYFVAGNSIGGYTALSAAAASGPHMVRGVVLANSAGRMVTQDEYAKEIEEQRGTVKDRMCRLDGEERDCVEIAEYRPLPNWLLAAGGQALFAYLQPSIQRICRNIYPTNPEAVDERLTRNIYRDSVDPGAVCVLSAGAKLPPPRSKNELFEEFGGPVLVTQGLKDPLGFGYAKTRYELYNRALPPERLRLVPLDAGHCPMHEAPEAVNTEIRAWIQETLAPFA